MKRFPCLLVGSSASALFPHLVDGTVKLATGRGIYWSTDSGRLLLLHDARYGFIPFGFGAEHLERWMAGTRIKRDDRVWMDQDELHLGQDAVIEHCGESMRQNGEMPTVHISDYKQAAARLQSAAGPMIKKGFSCLIPFAEQIIAGRIEPTEHPAFNMFARKACPALSELFYAIRTAENDGIGRAVKNLAGLGQGLTPSGDDVMLGMLAVFSLTGGGQDPGIAQFSSWIENEISNYTSEISAAYLLAAAAGERYSMIDEAIISAGTGHLSAVEELMKVGGSSGMDMLLGMILALLTLETSNRPSHWHKYC